MSLGPSILRSYRELQQGWVRLANSVFGKSVAPRDEMARGEFISAFISERDLSFPASPQDRRQGEV